jgi:uncharacterized protein
MRATRYWITVIAVFVLIYLIGGVILSYYTDWLWFGEVGYTSIFWKTLTSQLALGILAGIVFFIILYSNIWLARRLAPPVLDNYDRRHIRVTIARGAQRVQNTLIYLMPIIVPILVGLEASSHWFSYQMFVHATNFGIKDPVFHRDVGFFIFKLGFLRYVYGWLFFAVLVAGIAAAFVHYSDRAIEVLAGMPTFAPHVKAHLSVLLALLLFVRAWGYRLDAFNLLYSQHGFMYGAGYTDVHARLAAYQILAVVAVIAGIIALVNITRRGVVLPIAAVVILIAASIVLGGIYPGIVQQVYVTPNAIARETPYMRNCIEFTRKAFGLDGIDERGFPALNDLTARDIQNNRATTNSIRLWDYRPIQSTYNQLQALGPYYEIKNVDVDRYQIGPDLRQVMLAARELSADAIASRAGTWVNQHFQYTHGYGAVMSPVNKATSEGLPEFFVSDMPPVSTVDIKITRPQIYFGEDTSDYVIVNTQQPEYDYPSSTQPVYTRYAGKGGISVGSYLRRLAFAWRFGDTKLVLQNPITPQSRLMFRREIGDRVQTIFPFLMYDSDPYLVMADGKLSWIWDAYSVSERYPYSDPQPFSDVESINYIRNSVKIVIDAYDGTVRYYVADAVDPMVKTYEKIFPGTFLPMSKMPPSLRAHIRYPEFVFRVQTNALRTYHMRDPQAFYNRSDQWDIPNEIVETSTEPQPVEPYYVVMKLPEETNERFLLMRPFTPHGKDNMVAWMAAKCDPDDYGKIILYEFPKDKLIYGPAQIEARINQEPAVSQQLTLWNQGGSRVNRGNQLVIPIEKSLIYVKPLYLQSETSQIPELKRVIVAYGNQLAMEPTLDAALARIFGGAAPSAEPTAAAPTAAVAPGTPAQVRKLINQAVDEYNRAQDAQRKGDWAGYGEQQRALEQTLKQLQRAQGGS